MPTLAFTRSGSGAPLVLLHGLGCDRGSWDPVIPALAENFDVIAVDLPGFGESAPLPPGTEPGPAALAASVADLLGELGLGQAPHFAGNSLGGWVALELAAFCPVASVALLSPAGLWRRGTPLYCRISLRGSRWLSQHAAGLLNRVVGSRPGRALVLGQTHGLPTRMTAARARAVLGAMASCPGFDATFAATLHRHYQAGIPIGAPVTVAFGSRDVLLLRRQSRHLDELPPGTRRGELPGCGHLPMSDNPAAVTALITAAAAAAAERPARVAGA